jgi:hypothetical protein
VRALIVSAVSLLNLARQHTARRSRRKLQTRNVFSDAGP